MVSGETSPAVEAISTLSERQVEDLLALYRSEWWTQGREPERVREMLRHCDLIVAFCERDSRRLVAFSRVLTDRVYKALILDVIVARSHRKTGLGRALLDAVIGHPALRSVKHFELYCRPEMAPFYRQWGFSADLGLDFMRLVR